MSEEEKKAIENDILFQIDMELYYKFNDKFCKMNEWLGEIYSWQDLKDLEDSKNKTEINLLRQAVQKQQKEIEQYKEIQDLICKETLIDTTSKEFKKKYMPKEDFDLSIYQMGCRDNDSIWENRIKDKIEFYKECIKECHPASDCMLIELYENYIEGYEKLLEE